LTLIIFVCNNGDHEGDDKVKDSFQCLKYFSSCDSEIAINFLNILTLLCKKHNKLDYLESLKLFYEGSINKYQVVTNGTLNESNVCNALLENYNISKVCDMCPFSNTYTNQHYNDEYTVLAYLLKCQINGDINMTDVIDMSSITEDSFISKVTTGNKINVDDIILIELHKFIFKTTSLPQNQQGIKILELVEKSIGLMNDEVMTFVLDYYATLADTKLSQRSITESVINLEKQMKNSISSPNNIPINDDGNYKAKDVTLDEENNNPSPKQNKRAVKKTRKTTSSKKKSNSATSNKAKTPKTPKKSRPSKLQNQLSIFEKNYEHLLLDNSVEQKSQENDSNDTTSIESNVEAVKELAHDPASEKDGTIIVDEKNFRQLDCAIMSDNLIGLKLVQNYLAIFSMSDKVLYYLPTENIDLLNELAFYMEERDYTKICFDSISLIRFFFDHRINFKNIFDINIAYKIIPNQSFKTNEVEVIKEYTGEVLEANQYHEILKLYPVVYKTMTRKKLTLDQMNQYSNEFSYLSFLAASIDAFQKLGVDNMLLLREDTSGKNIFCFNGIIETIGSREDYCLIATKIGNDLPVSKESLFKLCAITIYMKMNAIKTDTKVISITDQSFQLMTNKKYQGEVFDILNITLSDLIKQYVKDEIPSLNIQIV